jgi:hypothetical protein
VSSLTLIVADDGEETDLNEGKKIKEESEKIKQEVKHAEATELQAGAKIKEEIKSDEARGQQEKRKEEEDARLATQAEQQGAARAKAEEIKAREEATRANDSVQAKKAEEGQAPSKALVETGVSPREIESVLSRSGLDVPSSCNPSCALRPTVEKAIGSSSNLTQAAKEVAAAIGDSRGANAANKPQLLGARVDYSVALDGLDHKVLFLTWTLCSRHTGRPLPREWWRNVTFMKYVPSSEVKELVGAFWAPIPSARGEYYYRLRVFDGSSEAAHTKTELFS